MRPATSLALFVAAALALTAARPAVAQQHEHPCSGMDVVKAKAVLSPTAGNQASGTVSFTREGDKIHVLADIAGLGAGTSHGFHIHEFGDCSAPDASSAGAHYNPTGHQHAGPPSPRHAGDLGNVVADAEGKAHLDLVVDTMDLGCGPAMVLGRGVVVHANPDDLTTQPTGNSGPRIACGVIGVAK
jgi:superoxide dismutase, Cu-Zn family